MHLARIGKEIVASVAHVETVDIKEMAATITPWAAVESSSVSPHSLAQCARRCRHLWRRRNQNRELQISNCVSPMGESFEISRTDYVDIEIATLP